MALCLFTADSIYYANKLIRLIKNSKIYIEIAAISTILAHKS